MYADPLDNATEQTEAATELAIAVQRAKAAPEQAQLPDGSWPTTECVKCDEPIGEVRLSMGKVRCIGCQTSLEEKGRMYAQR